MTVIEREREYWDVRYAQGFASGRSPEEGAEGNRVLWAAIEKELPKIDHIIDVGCGDLRIWGERNCQDYIGIDISRQILQENKNKRPHWKFICAPAETFVTGLIRENVFCFNLIYHILDPRNVARIFHNLCRYATRRIFVYTWIQNPLHPEITDGEYQRYNPMGKYLHFFEKMGFGLISVKLVKYPGALYTFKRNPNIA